MKGKRKGKRGARGSCLLGEGQLGGGEVGRGDVVVVPQVQVHDLALGEQGPHLRREDAKVAPGIRSRLRTCVIYLSV
jgi:hypothetical protein